MKLRDIGSLNRSFGRKNCWEHMQCGRQPGGAKAAELGVCPVSVNEDLHGVHGGRNAGRACWAVAGSFCSGPATGTAAMRHHDCRTCDFFRSVLQQESRTSRGFFASRAALKRFSSRTRQ